MSYTLLAACQKLVSHTNTMVLPVGDNEVSCMSRITHVIALSTPNDNDPNSAWGGYRTSVDASEAAGLDLLAALPMAVQNKVEHDRYGADELAGSPLARLLSVFHLPVAYGVPINPEHEQRAGQVEQPVVAALGFGYGAVVAVAVAGRLAHGWGIMWCVIKARAATRSSDIGTRPLN